jgi:hypothetical protein
MTRLILLFKMFELPTFAPRPDETETNVMYAKLEQFRDIINMFRGFFPKINYVNCDQKLASDSSGLPGGFSGQRAWVRIFKKWAPGSYCLELVVACPAAGTSAQILLVEGK